MSAAVAAVAAIVLGLSGDSLMNEPLPMAYLEAVEAVVIVPGIGSNDLVAAGQLLPGQRAEIWALVSDGYDGEIWALVSAPGGQTGWALCDGRARVVSVENGKTLGRC